MSENSADVVADGLKRYNNKTCVCVHDGESNCLTNQVNSLFCKFHEGMVRKIQESLKSCLSFLRSWQLFFLSHIPKLREGNIFSRVCLLMKGLSLSHNALETCPMIQWGPGLPPPPPTSRNYHTGRKTLKPVYTFRPRLRSHPRHRQVL